MKLIQCNNCNASNVVGICDRCKKTFIITEKRISKGMRAFEDISLSSLPVDDVQPCDYCLSRERNESITSQMEKGLRQRTCPSCRTECLTDHGLWKALQKGLPTTKSTRLAITLVWLSSFVITPAGYLIVIRWSTAPTVGASYEVVNGL